MEIKIRKNRRNYQTSTLLKIKNSWHSPANFILRKWLSFNFAFTWSLNKTKNWHSIFKWLTNRTATTHSMIQKRIINSHATLPRIDKTKTIPANYGTSILIHQMVDINLKGELKLSQDQRRIKQKQSHTNTKISIPVYLVYFIFEHSSDATWTLTWTWFISSIKKRD